MGKPLPGWDVALLDDDEQPVPRGETGEICLRARTNPHYPLGYWGRPEDSEEVFGGEWFHTKDVARQDDDGYVWYEGRNDDVIISAGYRIGPFEVESALVAHPSVVEAAAVASPDALRGHIVKAFVRVLPGVEPSDELAARAQGLRPRAPLGVRLPPRDRVRRRSPQDAHRQDPPHRASPAGRGTREAVVRDEVGQAAEASSSAFCDGSLRRRPSSCASGSEPASAAQPATRSSSERSGSTIVA